MTATWLKNLLCAGIWLRQRLKPWLKETRWKVISEVWPKPDCKKLTSRTAGLIGCVKVHLVSYLSIQLLPLSCVGSSESNELYGLPIHLPISFQVLSTHLPGNYQFHSVQIFCSSQFQTVDHYEDSKRECASDDNKKIGNCSCFAVIIWQLANVGILRSYRSISNPSKTKPL